MSNNTKFIYRSWSHGGGTSNTITSDMGAVISKLIYKINVIGGWNKGESYDCESLKRRKYGKN